MTDWITHEGTEPPLLAPAALVVVPTYHAQVIGAKVSRTVRQVDQIEWRPGLQYHPLTDEQGHKYVSAEGLKSWARWVATDEDGEVCQFEVAPELFMESVWDCPPDRSFKNSLEAPFEYRHPGNYRDSLCRVWREGHD